MKRVKFCVVVLSIAFSHLCRAAVDKMYYLGEAKLSAADGQSRGSQVILMEKSHDPDHSMIVERAIAVKADHTAEEYTMNMTVSGNAFTLKDAANAVAGAGTLFGPAWNWTYFRATYEMRNGIKIEDENFMADPALCVARKKISGQDGKVIMYMDITLNRITPATFELLSAAVLKK